MAETHSLQSNQDSSAAFHGVVLGLYQGSLSATEFPAAARQALQAEGMPSARIGEYLDCYATQHTATLCLTGIEWGRDVSAATAKPEEPRERLAELLSFISRHSPELALRVDELFAYSDEHGLDYLLYLDCMQQGAARFGHASVEAFVADARGAVIVTQLNCLALMLNRQQCQSSLPDFSQVAPRVQAHQLDHSKKVTALLRSWQIFAYVDTGASAQAYAQYNPDQNTLEMARPPSPYNELDSFTLFHELYHAYQDFFGDNTSLYHLERDANLMAAADFMAIHAVSMRRAKDEQALIDRLKSQSDERYAKLMQAQTQRDVTGHSRYAATRVKLEDASHAALGILPTDDAAVAALQALILADGRALTADDVADFDRIMWINSSTGMAGSMQDGAAMTVQSRVNRLRPLESLQELEQAVQNDLMAFYREHHILENEVDPDAVYQAQMAPLCEKMRDPHADVLQLMAEYDAVIQDYARYINDVMLLFQIRLGQLALLENDPRPGSDDLYKMIEDKLLAFTTTTYVTVFRMPPSLFMLAKS